MERKKKNNRDLLNPYVVPKTLFKAFICVISTNSRNTRVCFMRAEIILPQEQCLAYRRHLPNTVKYHNPIREVLCPPSFFG